MKIKLLIIVLFLFISVLSVYEPATVYDEQLKQQEIADWHVHVAGLGYGNSGNFINRDMRENFRFHFFMNWMDVSETELEKQGDQVVVARLSEKISQSQYIDQAVVLALDGVIDEQSGELDRVLTQFYVDNDFLATETAKYDNLIFGASINPKRADSLERLQRAHDQGAVLIKWIPSIMDIDPSDSSFLPFYQRMAELNLPLLTHTGMEKSFATAKDELADPRRLELALSTGLTVIAAHIATTGESEGEDNFQRILPMFAEYENLYADISSLTQINKLGYLAKALKQENLQTRMIYGTDWPLQYFPLTSPWYHIKHIGFMNAWRISHIDNVWDKDIELKRAFGVNKPVFEHQPNKMF